LTQDEADRQSCHSFSVSFAGAAARLSDADLATVLKAMTDPTPGLALMVRRDLRDGLIRELAALHTGATSAVAKTVADDLARYISGPWLREREAGPSETASAQRRLLFRIAQANLGASLSWRQVLNVIEGHRG
jgi:hypothetical protein